MNRDEAKAYIQTHATDILTRDKSGRGYVCPLCGSGSGKNGTGLTTKDRGGHFSCWAGCFTSADIFEIIGKQYHLNGFKDQLDKAAELFNIKIDNTASSYGQSQNRAKREPEKHTQTDYTTFFNEAQKHIQETTYHRGITEKTLERFKVGYIAAWKNPGNPQAPASPRLIIPTSPYSYIARSTDQNGNGSKIKAGELHLFNEEALTKSPQPVFIVEGEIDALSICDIGGEAVGLGGTSGKRLLLEALKANKPSQPLLLALDNDEPGKKAQAELAEELKKLNITFFEADIYGDHKDANEALTADKWGFSNAVYKELDNAAEAARAEKEAEKKQIQGEAVLFSLQDFLDRIKASRNAAAISTGFKSLDALLDGGLYAGLYVVGAVTSLGKTTLCLQIADNIASSGRDVLIVSLEMARDELIAKSISRLTFWKDAHENGSTQHAKTTRGILRGDYTKEEEQLITSSIADYSDIAASLYIEEGVGDIGIKEIKERVERHARITGRAPVVVVDYLQILAPNDPRATDKQNTDKAVMELKRLSRDFNTPVIAISSFNRDNYKSEVNLAAFKESGAIEYSSDVLIGLQYSGMNEDNAEAKLREIRQKNKERPLDEPIMIEAKILKNRNGRKDASAEFCFYPAFNTFTEARLKTRR